MRKYLFLCVVLLLGSLVHAQENPAYFCTAGAGVNFVAIDKVDGIDFAFDPGFMGTASLGFHLNKWVTTETEVALRNNRFRKVTADGIEFGVDGYLTKLSLMQNFILNLTQKKYSPYFGFGVGLKKDSGDVEIIIVNGPEEIYRYKTAIDEAGTAFQLLGGIDVPMGDVSRVKVEYKFLKSERDEQNHSVIGKMQKNF